MWRSSSAALVVLCAACCLSAALAGGVLPLWTPALAAAAALCCALARGTSRSLGADSRLVFLLAVPVGCTALQLVPLPGALVALLSPRAAELRPGAGPLSLDVPGTAYELARAAALLGLGLAAERLGAERRRARVLLHCLVAIGVLQSLVTAVHLATHTTRSILWLYPLPAGWEMGLGTFVNRNHAACLLLLTTSVTAGLLLDGGPRRGLLLLALLGQLLTLALSLSRGGLATAAVAGTIIGGAALRRQMGLGSALLLCLGTSALLGFLSVTLLPGLAGRLQPLLDGSLLHYQKVQVWRDVLPMLGDFWLTGAGRGAFQSVFTPYRTGDEYVTVPYAASLPLQQLAELGLPATLLLWGVGGALVAGVLRRRGGLAWAERGAAVGLGAVLLHNLVDFGLELPGVAVPACAALGLVVGRAHRRDGATPSPRRARVLGGSIGWVCAGAALVGLLVARHTLSADKVRLRQAVRDGDGDRAERLYQQAARLHPADAQVALLGADAALLARQPLAEVMRRSNRALLLHPADAQAHRIAARVLAAQGLRAQAALELRLAFSRGFLVDSASLDEAARLALPADLPDTLPQHPDTQRVLAAYLDSRGQREGAARARRRAALLDPGW